MRAAYFLAAHDFRRRWRSWTMVLVVLAISAGVVFTAFAGARRTDSAFPHMLQWSHPADVLVAPEGSGLGSYDTAVGHLPAVEEAGPVVGIQALPISPSGRLDANATVVAPLEANLLRTFDRPKILAGRLPGLRQPNEVAIDVTAAKHLHLGLGSVLRLGAVGANGPQHIRRLSERVVGVVVTRENVVPTSDSDQFGTVYATPSLLYGLGPNWSQYEAFDGTYVRLKPGTSPAAFTHEVQSLAHRYPSTGGTVFVDDEYQQSVAVERSIRPEAIALALFGLVAMLTMFLIVGQFAARQLSATASDYPLLGALGMTKTELAITAISQVALVAVAGAVLAAALAIVASPLMPIGPARLADLHPGMSVDAFVLGLGSLAVVVVTTMLVVWPAWRMAAGRQMNDSDLVSTNARLPGGLARTFGRGGVPLTASIGVRWALETGRGRNNVPLRTGVIGTALSVATVAATLTFGANFVHLVDTPSLYGQTWDIAVDVQFEGIPSGIEHQLAHRPGLTALTLGVHGNVAIRGSVVPAVGLAANVGPLLAPEILEGRAPRTTDEMVLGTSTLRRLNLQVGDDVAATLNGRRTSLHIVGRAVFPHFGQGSFAATDLGEGALLTADALSPPASSARQIALMSFAAGINHGRNVIETERSLTGYCRGIDQSTCLVSNQRPSDIADLARVEGTPLVLALVLGLFGIAVLAQLVVLYCRRRRRDLAVLKTMGVLRRQVFAITYWQTSALAIVSLLIGLPLGISVGRWIWDIFAANVGVATNAVIPTWTILLVVPVLVVVANLVASIPGRRSANLHPAELLRSE
jgi:hypothetical protein